MNRKIVVTGAAGSIGSVIARLLQSQGHSVLGIDRKAPDVRDFPWRYGDLQDRDVVMRALEGVDGVIHLGENPNLFGPFSPDEVFAQNTRIASTVFESASVQGVTRIIYASSAQMYGSWGKSSIAPEFLPFDETHPAKPRNAYGLSKYANERYLELVANNHKHIGAITLRFPGVIGTWHPWEVIVKRVHAHTEYHDGLGTYVHIEDLAEAFRLALDHTTPGEVRTYNAFADDIMNLTPVAEYLKTRWPHLSLPEDWPTHKSWVLNDLIRTELGWIPKYSAIEAWHSLQGK